MRGVCGRGQLTAGLATGLLILSVTSAWAQPSTGSFEQIQFKVEEGDAVRVTDTSGTVVRGELRKATETELWVDVGGEVRKFSAVDVAEVQARVFDRLWEGALIGAAAGGAFGVLPMNLMSPPCEGIECAAPIIGGAAAGAGIGIGIDAMIRRFRLIYSSSGRPSGTQVMVLPMTTHGARGAAVVIRF